MADGSAQRLYETAGRDEIAQLQLARLKDVLRRVYGHGGHYRRAMDAAGLYPGDLKTLEDLARFPFTTKADLRENYPFGMFAVPQEEIVRIHASSGTTGQPTVVGYTRADLETWAQLMARSIRVAGGTAQDIIHIAYNYGLFTGGLGFHYGAEMLGCAVMPVGGGMTARQVRLIVDFRPGIIAATPSYLLAIADEFDRQGVDAGASSLRVAMCGAEPWSEGMRAEIEERLGLTALDIYGLSELMGPGVAQEFAATGDGPTLWEDHFLPEVIDPETGAVLADGEPGKLVLTSLTREALPLIRYRTRDMTRLLPGTACQMRRIARIGGRSDDMMIIRGVNVFPTQIEAVLLSDPQLTPNYLIELERPERLDVMRVRIEARAALSVPERAEARRRAELAIKDAIGLSAMVEIVEPGTIPRSEGKAARVRDLGREN